MELQNMMLPLVLTCKLTVFFTVQRLAAIPAWNKGEKGMKVYCFMPV